MTLLEDLGEVLSLGDLCPRKGCGEVMTRTVCEHVIVHTCQCGYEAKTITGESKLAWCEVQGRLR